MAKKTKAGDKPLAAKKIALKKSPKNISVEDYMNDFEHPLLKEINAVRDLIKEESKLNERIKWNAPSYFYNEDLVTFNPRPLDHVHLVFHHPSVVKIKSDLLEGDYKDRRMMYFKNMAEVKKNAPELKRIIKEHIRLIENAKK